MTRFVKNKQGMIVRKVEGRRWGVIPAIEHIGPDPSRFIPYRLGVAGDRIWVKEKLIKVDGTWLYAADEQPVIVAKEDETAMVTWVHHRLNDFCQSMFMPRWASRILLEITDVRAERVQDISEEDARAEGCDFDDGEPPPEFDESSRPTAKIEYQALWDHINGADRKFRWKSNPYVWCISFRRIEVSNIGQQEVVA